MAASARSIFVNALSQTLGGGAAVARNLTAALAAQRPSAAFTLLCSNREVADGPYPDNVEVALRPTPRSLPLRVAWEQWKLPGLLERAKADVLLGLGGFALFTSGIPQVCVWQNPNIYARTKVRRSALVRAQIVAQRRAQYLSMKKARLNVFLSEDGVRECGTRWPMQQIPHRVIYHGISLDPAPAADGGAREFDRPFALAVGHSYYHKNYEALIDAMDVYRRTHGDALALVVAGGPVSAAHHRALIDSVERRQLGEIVHFLGAVSRERVADLYRSARVYVTTTLLESFGLTPLEAMSHGLPVLASDASCLPEICADAALYCDPRDPTEIARKLHELCSDDALREALRARGFERVKRFGWERCAEQHLAALDGCLGS